MWHRRCYTLLARVIACTRYEISVAVPFESLNAALRLCSIRLCSRGSVPALSVPLFDEAFLVRTKMLRVLERIGELPLWCPACIASTLGARLDCQCSTEYLIDPFSSRNLP